MSRNGSPPSSGPLSPTQDRRSRRLAGPRDILLRGGRLTKIAGAIASYAPALGRSVSALPLLTLGFAAFLSGIGFNGIGVPQALAQINNASCVGAPFTNPRGGGWECLLGGTVNKGMPSQSIYTNSEVRVGTTAHVLGIGAFFWTYGGIILTANGGNSITAHHSGNDGIKAIRRRDSQWWKSATLNVQNVTGHQRGINLDRNGAISIQARNVIGSNSDAIVAFSRSSNTSNTSRVVPGHSHNKVTINAGFISGGKAGISADSIGSSFDSGVNISVGQVIANGTGANDHGIWARTSSGNISVATLEVRANAGAAVRAKNLRASGTISVTARSSKPLSSNSGVGVHLELGGGTATVNAAVIGSNTTTQGTVSNNHSGKGLRVDGGGTVSLTATGSPRISTGGDGVYWRAVNEESVNLNLARTVITSSHGKGIDVDAGSGSVDIDSSSTITSSGAGIIVDTTGDVSVDVASVTSQDSTGIDITGDAVTVIASAVAGGGTSGYGIKIVGSDDVTINTASVTSNNSTGIYASGNAVRVTVAGRVKGGIRARGTGGVTVSVADDVTSTASSGIGVLASSSNNNAVIAVDGNVSASGGNGVEAHGNNVDVTVSGNVTSTSANGDGMRLVVSGGVAEVTAENVTGGSTGISVDSTNGATANIEVGKIYSGQDGITWTGTGNGNVSLNIVSAEMVASSQSRHGIAITNAGTTANVNVDLSAGSKILAANNGIGVRVVGNNGDVDLDLKGTVSGGGGGAVYVDSVGKVTVKAARTVTGKVRVNTAGGTSGGIYIDKHGTGDVEVTSWGFSTSTADGIYVHNRNTGNVTVSASGNVAVSGSGNSGIVVKNLSSGGEVTVTATDVTFSGANRTIAGDGVYVSNLGTGSVSVSVSGTVRIGGRSGTSGDSRGDGIRVKNIGSTASMNISVGTVSAQRHGVYADHSGSGRFSLSVSGAVTGGNASSDTAIYVKANAASQASIVVNSGGSVGASSSSEAIKSGGGDMTVTFSASSRLAGRVSLGGGTDSLHVDGSFTSDLLDGGTGVDLLDFSGAIGTAKSVSGWETINITDNASVTIQGALSVDSALKLESGSWLRLNDGAPNAVTVGTAGGTSATFRGGGTAVIEIDGATGKADRFDVNGGITGTTTLRIDQVPISAADALKPLQDKIVVADIADSANVTRTAFRLEGGQQGFRVVGGRGEGYKLDFNPNNNTFILLGQDGCFRQGEPGLGVFRCRGTIAAATALAASGNTDLVVTMEEDMVLTASATVAGVTLSQTENTNGDSEGGIDFDQKVGGQIVGGSGIVARNEGEGDIDINVIGRVEGKGAAISSLTLGYGIHARNVDISGGSLSVEVKRTGAVVATSVGILAHNMGTGDTTVDSDAGVGGSTAIQARNIGGGGVEIKAGGALTGNIGDGVYVFNSTSGTQVEIDTSRVRGGRHAIHALNRGSAGLTVSISGTAAGGASGVVARNWNRGSISISAIGTVTGEGRDDGHAGIDAESMSSSAGRLVVVAATVFGGDYGIRAINRGTGALEINTRGRGGRVEGKRSGVGVGIHAFNQGTDMKITATTVSGAVHGVRLTSSGTGDLSFDAFGNVTGVTGHGIQADNSSTGKMLSISADNASVSGGMSGVIASNEGTGGLSVAAGTVTGDSGYAIRALNLNGGAVSIRTAGHASGGVTTDNSSVATKPAAIAVFNDASGSGLSITADSVSGASFGIWARNEGKGSVSVSAAKTVTGGARAGIRAFNVGSSVESSSVVSVSAKRVSGATNGIWASNSGGGDVSIAAEAVTVASTGSYAVSAVNYNGGAVSIDLTGRAVGGTATGTNSKTELAAIAAFNDVGGSDLKITAASASGGGFGIWANNQGTGSVTVAAQGRVVGANKAGIAAINASTDSSSLLSISAQQVSGATHGIFSSHTGGGAVSVNAAGAVSGSKGHGIYGFNASRGGLTVTAAEAVSGAGSASNVWFDGIHAINSGAATSDVRISAAKTVTGSGHGVRAVNEGSGQIQITASGAVTGAAGHGIYAKNTGNSTNASSDVRVTAATVTGLGSNSHGIFVQNVRGGGLVSIVATGNVTGSGTGADGIRATNSLSGAVLNVSVGPLDGGILGTLTVFGSAHGINVTNRGTGNLTIGAGRVTGARGHGIHAKNESGGSTEVRVRGVVSGSGGSSDGIHAVNDDAAGVNVEVVVESGGSVNGARSGIRTVNKGTGHVLIRSLGGRIAGAAGHGIHAYNVGSSVNASSVTVSVAAAVTGSGAAGDGIYVKNKSGSGPVSVTARSEVTGGHGGITVDNEGSGNVVVTASAAVSGAAGHGIQAKNTGDAASASSNVRVTAATVTGSGDDGHGIWVSNSGGGGISISATGAVSGSTGHGIFGRNANGGALTVTAAETVSGAGSASNVWFDGIHAINSGAATSDVRISAAKTVTGSGHGVKAVNEGSGQIAIAVSGAISGANNHGIHARNTGNAANSTSSVTITVATVTGSGGGSHGIFAENTRGGGIVSVVATGNVTGSGSGSDGIRASNSLSGAGLNVSVGPLDGGVLGTLTVSGGGHGIHATKKGGGDLTIGAGTVTGAAGIGIHAKNEKSGSTEVTVRGAVSGSGGSSSHGIYAVNTGTAGGNVEVTVASGGSVSGAGRGIHAENKGTGHVSVLSTGGRITGAAGHGVFAYNFGRRIGALTSSVTVSVSASVVGSGAGSDGISAENKNGGGVVSVAAKSNVTGARYGIWAANSAHGSSLEIAVRSTETTYDAAVVGGRSGIQALGSGSGNLSISAGAVTGSNAYGIAALNRGGGSVSIKAVGSVLGGSVRGTVFSDVVSSRAVIAGIAAFSDGSGSSIEISAATVTGGGRGIWAKNAGTGAVTVTASGAVRGSAGTGVYAYSKGVGSDSGSGVTVSVATVTGNIGTSDGIHAKNESGGGAVSISALGDVSGGRYGIYAQNSSTAGTSVAITAGEWSGSVPSASKDVTGGRQGIRAFNFGSGDMTISAGAVTGEAGGYGVNALNYNGGSVSIVVTGTVEGTGVADISLRALTKTDPAGIAVFNDSSGNAIFVSAATVTGQTHGIWTQNDGSGALTISASDVQGKSGRGHGIHAKNENGGHLGISVSQQVVTSSAAGGHGIFASGTESVGVVVGTGAGAGFVGGTVVGGQDGVHAFDSGSGNLSISAGDVTGHGNTGQEGDGIDATNTGGGALSIQVTGNVAGKAAKGSGNNTNDGIWARNDSDGTTLSIIAGTGRGGAFAGSRVSGGDHGIFADNSGSGPLSISAGVVTGGAGFGIHAKNANGGRLDINVTKSVIGSSTTGKDGIFASSTDSVAVVVGTGTGTSFVGGTVVGGNDGIRAFGSGSGDLTISAGNVTGRGNDGIDATNMGGGALVVHVTGDVSGKPSGVRPEDNDGIRALNASGTTRLEIIAGTGRDDAFSGTGVSGGDDGISATNFGNGALTISAGSVTGHSGFGVWASNMNGDALSIQATGKIVAKTSATETDTGADRHGVFAYNDASGSTIDIDAAAIESHNDGVYALNRGSGSISISAASIKVTGSTTRGGYGVNAFNYNGGAVRVSVTGPINASTNTQKVAQSKTQPAGVAVFNDASGSDVSVTAAAVDGAKHGIWVHNLGSGALSIAATGPVGGSLERNDGSKDTENGGHGVFADNSGTGALGISVAAVNGGNAGVFARNHAGGRLLVVASGTVKGLGNASARQPEKYGDGNGDGIYASNHAAGTTSLTVFAAGVEGFDEGIDVRNLGSDSVTVISTGSVIGNNGDGLRAYNSASGTSMQIAVNSAVGGQNRTTANPTLPLEVKDREGSGIHAMNRGSGELAITVTGSARSGRADVKVADPNSRGDLVYNYDGIRARNHGGGKVVITVNGDVSSEQGDAIDVVNSLGDVPVSAADRRRSEVWIDVAKDGALAKVEGGDDGIRARNGSGGDMRITVHGKGTVVGGSHAHAANTPLGLIEFDKEIGHAIWASADGGGDVIVNVAADSAGLVSTGPNDIPRSASYVEGHRSGIYARNTGGGDISISIAKSVRGGKFDNPTGGGGRRQGWAPVVDTNVTGSNAKTTIMLEAGAEVSVSSGASAEARANGISIRDGDGDSEVTVKAGASVGNSVALGDGTDMLLFRGGAFRKDTDGKLAATQIFDGGEGGSDKLHFAKSASVPTQRVRDLPERREGQFFYSADMLAANLRNWEEIRFGAETRFRFAGSQTLDADKVQSFGLLTMNNEKAEDRLAVSGNFEGGGYVGIDVDFFEGAADLLEIKGDATGETVLVVEDIAGRLGGTGGDITVAKVDGSVDSSAFTLDERPITAGRGIYGYYLKLLFDRPTGTFRLGGARSGGGVTDTGSIIEATPSILLSGFAKAPGLFMRNLSRLASRSRSVSSRANAFSPATRQNGTFGVNAAAPRLGENAWVWFTAEQEKFQPSDNNGEAETSSHGVRAGLDVLSFEVASGDWTVALTGQYDKVDATSTGLLNKKGRLEAIGYGIGFNATWYGISDLYVDAQTKVGWIQSELSSDTDGVLISDNASSAWLSSIEIGKHFAIGSTGYINAIPQFQLTAGQLNGGNFVDLSRYERHIDFGSERAGAARLGMALEFTGISGNGYVMSSVVKEFSSARDVEVDAVKISTEADPDYFEAGLGGSLAIGDRSTIFAEGKYRTSFGGDEKSTKNYGGSLSLGVQWQW